MSETPQKRIGELNGPWAILLKVALVLMPIAIPVLIAWATWVTSEIHKLDVNAEVTQQILTQIGINTTTLARHEKSLIELTEANQRGGRFTSDMAENQRLKIMADTNTLVADKVESLRKDIAAINSAIMRLTIQLEERK